MNDIKRDLEYLMKKYSVATEKGKPAPRLAAQLKLIIDTNEIYLESKIKHGN